VCRGEPVSVMLEHFAKLRLFASDRNLFVKALKKGYRVRSTVTTAICREFVRAIEGKAVSITPGTVDGLELLCNEFGFRGLDQAVTEFRSANPAPAGSQEMLVKKEQIQGQSNAIEAVA